MTTTITLFVNATINTFLLTVGIRETDIAHSSQCSTTGLTKAVVCTILSIG